MGTGNPDRQMLGRAGSATLWGHPWAIAAGTTEILNKDDKSGKNQALSAREFPECFSGLKNYSCWKNKESGRGKGQLIKSNLKI